MCRSSFTSTSGILARAAQLHRDRIDELSALLTLEVGKPVTQARGEVELVASIYQYYADHAEALLADEPLESNDTHNFVRHLPLGPVLAVMPWNFPLYLSYGWKVAPALAAGNSVILKHSSRTPLCGTAFEQAFAEAGAPPGLVQAVTASHQTTAALVGSLLYFGLSLSLTVVGIGALAGFVVGALFGPFT